MGVLECAGHLQVTVLATPSVPHGQVQLRYYTQEGTAKEDKRFKPVEGYISFSKGVTSRTIDIPIIDDNLWQPQEQFSIHLENAHPVSRVSVINALATATGVSRFSSYVTHHGSGSDGDEL